MLSQNQIEILEKSLKHLIKEMSLILSEVSKVILNQIGLLSLKSLK